jgi:short-subunit dehydrogenase
MLAFASALPPDPMPHRATYAATKGFIATFTRTLAAELDGRPVRLQLLCPGYTKTEFHMTHGTAPVQGEAPTDEPFGMSPADVVQASLVALETGELVVVPGLEDPAAIERLIDAELGVRASDRGGALASRYSG